jgi:hypothetical protein
METKGFIAKYNLQILLGGIFVVLLIILGLLVRSTAMGGSIENQQLLSEVARLTRINSSESPVVAVIRNAENLRKESALMAEVYKDAIDGDYFLSFSNEIIIYRRQDNIIVYQGPTPAAIQQQRRDELASKIRQKAKENGVVITDTEQVQLTAVTDPEVLKKNSPDFYAQAQQGDVVAVFPISQKIILYRPNGETLVNSASFQASLTK